MKQIVCFLVIFFGCGVVFAQYPTASFSFPGNSSALCRGEQAAAENNSILAASFLWDFCPETFTETPIIKNSGSITGLVSGWGYKVVRSGNEWFGFLIGRNT